MISIALQQMFDLQYCFENWFKSICRKKQIKTDHQLNFFSFYTTDMSIASKWMIPTTLENSADTFFIKLITQSIITNPRFKENNLHTYTILQYSVHLFSIMIFVFYHYSWNKIFFSPKNMANIEICPKSANLGATFNLYMISSINRWMSLNTFHNR